MTGSKVSRIVVGYDYSSIAALAVRRAFDFAATADNAEVHVLTVVMLGDAAGSGVAGVPAHPTVSMDVALEALDKRVTELSEEWKARNGTTLSRVVTHVRSEAPAYEIAQLASDLEARLVVVGTHGRRGMRRLLLGSVAEGVVRQAHCEVLVVRPVDADAEIPQIEPPCPRCVEERAKTNGKELWCEQHRERHGQRHTNDSMSRLDKD